MLTSMKPDIYHVSQPQAVNNRGTPQILSNMLSQWHRHAGGRPDIRQQEPPAGDQPIPVMAFPPSPPGQYPTSAETASDSMSPTHNTSSASMCAVATAPQGQQQNKGIALQQPVCGAAMLLQVPVHPSRCSCVTFGDLFTWLLQQHGMLCCGLYRQAWHCGCPLYYVYTNPHKVSSSGQHHCHNELLLCGFQCVFIRVSPGRRGLVKQALVAFSR